MKHLINAPHFAAILIVACLLGGSVRARAESNQYNVRDFGVVGDGKTKETAAFQKALDTCAVNGGGDVVVPAGTYLIGSVQIGYRTILRLEKDAVIVGSDDLADYPMIDIRWEGRWQPGHRALIYSADVDHIGIVGPGRIDGSAKAAAGQNPRGAVVLEPVNCNDVHWEGFTVTQGGNWATHPTYCNDVVIKGLTIRGNRDGIDVDSCKNVRIEDCDIDTGDDSISLKSGRGMNGARIGRAVEDVTISNCTLRDRRFACIGIGSETSGGVKNIRIEKCKMTAFSAAIYIKTRVGRAGVNENISADDVDVFGGNFLRINLTSAGNMNTADDPVEGAIGIPSAKNLSFSNIRLHDVKEIAQAVQIAPEKPIEGLKLEKITGNAKSGISLQHIRDAAVSGIDVSGVQGIVVMIADVTGSGLEGAGKYTAPPPTSRRSATTTSASVDTAAQAAEKESPAAAALDRPDPKEIPLPAIDAPMGKLPGVDELPVRRELPDVMTMNDGTKVTTPQQWPARRAEMLKTLEYYAVGQAPPPPGNVRGREVKSEVVGDGKYRYRLIELSFGPEESLHLNIGVFTPASGGPFPAVIAPAGTPPYAAALPRQPNGPTQGHGQDALLVVGNDTGATSTGATRSTSAPSSRPFPGAFGGPQTPEKIAASSVALSRGYAYVIFNYNDCGEDTTLRNADGNWAFRNSRFFPAYPNYDWGLLRAWAWGVSRIVDYLQTDPAIDKSKIIITGASRLGKSAMVAAAFDDRIAMGAPVVTGGGGIGAYRLCGPRGSETLTIMVRKYPNWFSPHLHEFWGQAEKLPFDEHWFLACCAPRPFIALEGETDTISLPEAVKASIEAARPAYALFGAADRLGVNYAKHGHAFTSADWNALLDFADKNLLGKKVDRTFDQFFTPAPQ